VVVGGLLRRGGEKVVLRRRGWHPSHCPIQERARLRKKSGGGVVGNRAQARGEDVAWRRHGEHPVAAVEEEAVRRE
jgi:hypothetical protein